VLRIAERNTRTLLRPAQVAGRGFITGTAVTAQFAPAPAGAGIAFVRTDLPGSPRTVARVGNVTATARRTTLGTTETGVTLVEHVLAALAALKIDNCTVTLDGPEPPGLDGSADEFVRVLLDAGTATQAERRCIASVTEPVSLGEGSTAISLYPATEPGLRVTYYLDYGPNAALPPQRATYAVEAGTFAREIAPCRTFLLEHEAHALRAAGVGRHLTEADVVVFGPRGPLHGELRFADEPARHKLLDVVGDLALCGFDLAGHVVAVRSGHALNVALARMLTADPAAARRAA
jgi:UDP-3-O-[3-hydroxymyristoyl] N-acetylglucosamine deacetylase